MLVEVWRTLYQLYGPLAQNGPSSTVKVSPLILNSTRKITLLSRSARRLLKACAGRARTPAVRRGAGAPGQATFDGVTVATIVATGVTVGTTVAGVPDTGSIQ